MKCLFTLRLFLTLLLITTFSYKLSAQSYSGQGDSVKRVIIVVRPGYSDQSSDNSSSSLNNKPGRIKPDNSGSNNQSSLGSDSSTTTSGSAVAPTTAERAGTPDYMKPVAHKHKPIHVSTVPQTSFNKPVITSVTSTDTTISSTDVKTKHDTVFITKVDTVLIATPKHTSNKILFLELGGPGLAISINYDQRFSGGKEGWGYRVGTGYFGDGGNTVFTVPLQINYLLGSNGKYFEFGGGTTFLNTTGDNKGKTFIFDRITGFIGTATIGVRYEPEKSLNFRLGFVPIFSNYVIYAGGFSVGYTF